MVKQKPDGRTGHWGLCQTSQRVWAREAPSGVFPQALQHGPIPSVPSVPFPGCWVMAPSRVLGRMFWNHASLSSFIGFSPTFSGKLKIFLKGKLAFFKSLLFPV